MKSPSPWGSLTGDVSTEPWVLAPKRLEERTGHTRFISEMIQNFRTECSWFSSTKLMLLLFFQTWNTLWILSEHNFCYGGNISSGKGQVNVLTWLPWWGLWTPGRMYLGSSHKRVMAWQNKCTARLIFLPVNTLPGWAAEGETLREAGSPQSPRTLFLSQKWIKDPAVLSFQNPQQGCLCSKKMWE